MYYKPKILRNKSVAESITFPKGVSSLDLSNNNLSTCVNLLQILRDIPQSVRLLNLSRNNFHKKLLSDLFQSIATIPLNVVSLDLSQNNLYQILGTGLAELLAAIPKGVTSLNLSGNVLGNMPSEDLALALAALPKNITSLNLSGNNLSSLSTADLIKVLAAIPKTVTSLNLSMNDLGSRSASELNDIISSSSQNRISLNLSENNLHNIGAALAQISASLRFLDLSNNALGKLTEKELLDVIQAIPKTVTKVDLCHNELLRNKSISKRDVLLKSLQPFEQDGRLLLSHNGEPAFARALLPMLSLVKQGGLPLDIVSHILSYFLRNPEKLYDNQLIQNKIIQSVTANKGVLINQRYKQMEFFSIASSEKIEELKKRAKNAPKDENAAATLAHFCIEI